MEKWIFFLRAFFPSWRFFVDAGPSFSLEVRVREGQWEPAVPQITRSFRNLLLNPEGNFRHACNNNLLHLSQDLARLAESSSQEPQLLCSYQLTHNIVRFHLDQQGAPRSKTPYQFRVISRSSEIPAQNQILLESPIYEF